MNWDSKQFDDAFRIWFKQTIEKESHAKSFKKEEWCKRIGLDGKRFRSIKKPGNRLFVRLDDIVRIADGLNTTPLEIIKEVSELYKKTK